MPRKNKWIILTLLLFLIGGGLWFLKERFVQDTQMGAHKNLYYCPMHPAYTSDRPGDCPICNMRLVKKEREGSLPSAAGKQSVCVRHNCTMLNCPMEIVAKPGTKVTCPICGHVVVSPSGEWVKEKKILYWTDPMMPDFKSDKPGKSPMGMELIPVYEEDKTLTEGMEGVATFFVSPEKQQLIGVKKGVTERKTLTKEIRTTGMVSYDRERLTLPAAEVPKSVWIFATLYEYEKRWVKPGDRAAIETEVYSGETVEGIVQEIGTQVDPATRSVRVTLEAPNPEGKLTREMSVTVRIQTVQEERLAVPTEAVLDTGERQVVFVVKGEGSFEPRLVRLGTRSEEFVEILEGLSEGETVVTSATFLIDSESRLKSVAPTEHKHGQ
ncbi:MAG: efflux RND transporter periplasmic adaptor subunit [Candidatus Omnitrophica bacterium]|nr:efflux RND transporter periplasmic adaptor subunit [Candidatus Omnitrophota bacterium]